MQKLNIIRITEIIADNNNPARVQLSSSFRNETIIVPFSNKPGSPYPSIETARNHLTQKGHSIVGYGKDDNLEIYIISQNFFTMI